MTRLKQGRRGQDMIVLKVKVVKHQLKHNSIGQVHTNSNNNKNIGQ